MFSATRAARCGRAARPRCRLQRALPAAASPPPQPAAQAGGPSDEDVALVLEAQRVLLLLQTRREMTLPEVRLVLMVEDPRAAARRREFGVEADSGCSRDDVLAALADVAGGRVPADGVALRTLVAELQAWPYLESDLSLRGAGLGGVGGSAQPADGGPAAAGGDGADDDVMEEPAKDLSSYVPKWLGWAAPYIITAIPVFITAATVSRARGVVGRAGAHTSPGTRPQCSSSRR